MQRFTFLFRDRPPEIKRAPVERGGQIWARGAYEEPDVPSPLDVRVGNAGIKVWMVIQWLKASDHDQASLLRRYGEVLDANDVDNALWFYERNGAVIDERIEEEMQPV